MTGAGSTEWDWRDTSGSRPRPQRIAARSLPSAESLTYGQSAGWNCVWCGTKLTSGAVSAGVARGRQGAHVLDIEVYACPDCARREDDQ